MLAIAGHQKEFAMSYGRIVTFAVVALLLSGGRLRAEDRPVDVSPAADVDENLFVLRALANQYNLWPANAYDGKAALKFAEEGRVEVKYLRSIARRDALDGGIVGMCDDFFTLMDEYESTLARLGEIDQKAQEKAITDAIASFVKGAIGGLDAGIKAGNKGKNELQVDAATGLAFGDKGLKEFVERSRERHDQTNSSVADERARFESVFNYAMQRNAAAARAVAERRHWAQGEAGFDLPAGTPLKVLAERRAHDPFAKLALASDGANQESDPAGFMQRARLCIAAARLIPADAAFTAYRLDALSDAMWFACNAAGTGLNNSYRDTPTAYAQEAINIVKAYQQADPADREGWGRMQLVRALSDAGRFNEAITEALPLMQTNWKTDRAFAFRYARLMGVTNNADFAARWIRFAYSLGYSEVEFIKKSPDFECVRTQTADEFAALTTPKVRVRIAVGFLDDGVEILNDSPFPMTNIKVHATVIAGAKIWQADKVLPYVAGKSTGTIDYVFKIPDGRYDRLRWSLTSDQGDAKSEE